MAIAVDLVSPCWLQWIHCSVALSVADVSLSVCVPFFTVFTRWQHRDLTMIACSTLTGHWPQTGATSRGIPCRWQPFLNVSLRFDSSTFRKISGEFTKAKQLFGSKPMSRRRQSSLARSAIAKQAIDGRESEGNVGSS